MSAYDIVPSCSPLIDDSSLSDDIVIPDISEVPIECMCSIDRPDDLFISLGCIHVAIRMMEDDAIDLFGFFYREYQGMPLLTISSLYYLGSGSGMLSDIGETLGLSSYRVDLCLCLGSSKIVEISGICRPPYWTICIADRLISSPRGTRYYDYLISYGIERGAESDIRGYTRYQEK
jgi:hypothetical protein